MRIRTDADSPFLRYGCAVVGIALATGFRLLLDPFLGDKFPFATIFFAVMVAAWYGGFGPALTAALLGALACARFLLPPRTSFAIEGFDNQGGMVLYLLTSFGIALLGGAMRQAQRRAEDRRKQTEAALEDRMLIEERLRVTLQSIGDAVITTDSEAKVMFLNPVAVALTGWSQEEAQGRPLLDVFKIINERTREQVENPATKALREGRVVGLANHTILISKDGTERCIDDSAAPMRDAQGNVLGAVLIFRDITERRQAERSLVQSEARKAGIVNTSLDGIITIDHEGKIIEFNPAAQAIFGYRSEEVLGREMAALIIPPALREQHRQGMTRYLQSGEGPVLNRLLELTAIRSDGSEFPVELAITPIEQNNPPIFTGYIRDITERKKVMDRLEKTASDMSEADRRKDEFLAMLAHELRNPLAPMSNALQIMRLETDNRQPNSLMTALMDASWGTWSVWWMTCWM